MESKGFFAFVYLNRFGCFGWQENGQESFEELQRLFVEMFQSDMDNGFGGPTAPYNANGHDRFSVPASAASSSPCCNGDIGGNKRDNSAMDAAGTFCFGVSFHFFPEIFGMLIGCLTWGVVGTRIDHDVTLIFCFQFSPFVIIISRSQHT